MGDLSLKFRSYSSSGPADDRIFAGITLNLDVYDVSEAENAEN